MYVVPKNDRNRAIRKLSEFEEVALREYWRSRTERQHDSAYRRAALRVIRDAHDARAWIVCDCEDWEPGEDSTPWLLFPIMDGDHFTVRRALSDEHAPECVFAYEDGELEAGGSSATAGACRRGQPRLLLYGGRDALGGGPGNERNGPQRRRRQIHRLARVLFWLFEEAGVQTYLPGQGDRSFVNDLDAVRDFAEGVQVVPGLSLNEILFTRVLPNDPGFANCFERMRGRWPARRRWQGFVLRSVTAIEGQRLCFANGLHLDIDGEIRSNAIAGADARGPYVALISVVHDPAAGRFRAANAYVHARLKSRATLVDSGYERDCMSALQWAVDEIEKRTKLHCRLTKPLLDIPTSMTDSEVCKPDFLLEYSGKRLVVECMGIDSDEYRERKARTHPLMRRLGDLIEYDRTAADEQRAGRRLIASVLRWAGI